MISNFRKEEKQSECLCFCQECEWCGKYKYNQTQRVCVYWCNHPDQDAIQKNYEKYGMKGQAGLIGAWGEDNSPLSISPIWCPQKTADE